MGIEHTQGKCPCLVRSDPRFYRIPRDWETHAWHPLEHEQRVVRAHFTVESTLHLGVLPWYSASGQIGGSVSLAQLDV